MSRIGGIGTLGTAQLKAIRRINQLGQAIIESQTRLTTLKRINSARDDPSGLIQASLLELELTASQEAQKGLTRASAVLTTADSVAAEILTQLTNARTEILASAGGSNSSSEDAASQIVIDAIVRSIDSLAKSEFNGQQLLNGNAGFTSSGVDTSKIIDVDVVDKQTGDDVSVSITVDSTALQATNSYTGGALGSDTTLTIAGPDGTATVSLSSADSTQTVTDAINAVTYATGIEATRIDASQIDFNSIDFGTDATLSITATAGTFNLTTSGTVKGTDAVATINGTSVTGDGSTFNYNSSSLSLVVEVGTAVSGAISSFTVSGQGLEFVVGSDPSATARIGLPSLTSASLGGITGRLNSIASGGANTVTGGKAAEALKIVDDAIADVTRSQAIIGGFQKFTLDSSSRVLGSTIVNLSSALSAIQDTDIAAETAKLTNSQLLQQTAFQALQITSFQNQAILGLIQNTARRF